MDGASRRAKNIYLALSMPNSKPCPMQLRCALVVSSSSKLITTHYYYEMVLLGDREGYRLPLVKPRNTSWYETSYLTLLHIPCRASRQPCNCSPQKRRPKYEIYHGCIHRLALRYPRCYASECAYIIQASRNSGRHFHSSIW